YDKITVGVDMPQGELTIDSENDSASSVITKIVNRPFLIYLNQLGKVEKEEGLSDIMNETQPIDQSTVLASLGLELFNEHTIAKMMEAVFTIFPDHPIGIGDSWQKNNQQRINNQFILNDTTTYTLESLNEDLAWINID